MNKALLNPEVQEFIESHLTTDLNKLIFKASPFKAISMSEIVAQIAAKKTAVKKLPSYAITSGIIYPPKKNLEQASSEDTALYKASLISGSRAADLTGGFGIDSYFIGKQVTQLAYFELNQDLSELAAHNFEQLGLSNIEVFNKDGLKGIANTNYDWIYLDPDRRSTGKKAFILQDCAPDVTQIENYLLKHSKQILIKTSPVLDLHQTLKDLQNVSQVHAVASGGELKELLFILNKQDKAVPPTLFAVDIQPRKTFSLEAKYGEESEPELSMPKQYLYIPNAALMKLQLFGSLCSKFGVTKLADHSHFFTSASLLEFPGRAFKINQVEAFTKKNMQDYQGGNYLVISRNFPLSVAELRKRWKLKDKGHSYLIFTTLMTGEKVVFNCELVTI